jgi:hypothetical protein
MGRAKRRLRTSEIYNIMAADTPVQFEAPDGLDLILKLYQYGSTSIANGAGGDAAAQLSNKLYETTVSDSLVGFYNAIVVDTSDNLIATYHIELADTEDIHRCGDVAVQVQALRDLLEADVYVDTTAAPWQVVWIKRGTGNISTGVELMRKDIKDVTGAGITSTEIVMGRLVQP